MTLAATLLVQQVHNWFCQSTALYSQAFLISATSVVLLSAELVQTTWSTLRYLSLRWYRLHSQKTPLHRTPTASFFWDPSSPLGVHIGPWAVLLKTGLVLVLTLTWYEEAIPFRFSGHLEWRGSQLTPRDPQCSWSATRKRKGAPFSPCGL